MRIFWTTADLRARGKTAREIARAARRTELLSVQPGRWASPSASLDLVRAVRVGGVATAHTAARARGLWTPPDSTRSAPGAGFSRQDRRPPLLHVAVRKNNSRSRLRHLADATLLHASTDPVVLHWTPPAIVLSAEAAGIVDVLTMLEHLFACELPERALAVGDSALRHRHLRTTDLAALADRLPHHLKPVVQAADARAESGTETIVRYLLRLAGLRVEPQFTITGVGRVDLLVGGRLVIEVDGKEWHDDQEAFERDRKRDLVAATGRYRTLRLTWFQVLFQWPQVEAAVFAALTA